LSHVNADIKQQSDPFAYLVGEFYAFLAIGTS